MRRDVRQLAHRAPTLHSAPQVNILTSFRPGDIVRAEVISLGESQSLLLSTAKDHLGVLHAKAQAQEPRKRAKH